MRAFTAVLCLVFLVHPAAAQGGAGASRGAPPPNAVVPAAVQDSDLIRLFNSVRVLGEEFAGNPGVQLRILGSWGESAQLDCDCLLTRVYVAINLDGEDLRVYRLPELLEPKVDSIVTEHDHAVAYVAYGQTEARQVMRIEVLASSIRVSDASGR